MSEYTIEIVIFLIGTAIGGVVTHFFSALNDHRKAFNESADKLYDALTERQSLRGYFLEQPLSKEFDDIKRRMFSYKIEDFNKAIFKYNKVISENVIRDGFGDYTVTNKLEIIEAIQDLKKHTERRKFF